MLLSTSTIRAFELGGNPGRETVELSVSENMDPFGRQPYGRKHF
jgi:hypothetical protein